MEGAVAQIGPIEEAGDDTLVERASRGDHQAFADLVESRVGSAFRTASAILGDEAAAHDVVQDAFVSAWMHLPRLRDIDRFDAWLNQIIRNGCRDALRRAHRVREVSLDEATRLSSHDDYFEMTALNGAFERLPVDQRQLLALHHLSRLPVGEIARQLRIPLGTAKWRLHRARRALERALEVER